MVGYEREDLLGQAALGSDDAARISHLDARGDGRIKTHGVCTAFEKECIRKDGSRVTILISAALMEQCSARDYLLSRPDRA